MNGRYLKKNVLGQLAIVLHAHLPYVRKNEKNSLEEDWLFQAILECYIPLLQAIESAKKCHSFFRAYWCIYAIPRSWCGI